MRDSSSTAIRVQPIASPSRTSRGKGEGDFTRSGTADHELTFGAAAGLDVVNTGTAHVGGTCDTLTFGEKDAAAMEVGGFAGVGLTGIGIDDVAEDIASST